MSIPLEIDDELVALRNIDAHAPWSAFSPVVAAKSEIGMCAVHAQPGTASRDDQQNREVALDGRKCPCSALRDHAHSTPTPTRRIDTAAFGWPWSSRGGSHHNRTSVFPGVAARSYGAEGGVSLSGTVTVPTTVRPTCRAHSGPAPGRPVRGHAVAAGTAAPGRRHAGGAASESGAAKFCCARPGADGRERRLRRPWRSRFTASRRAQGRAARDARRKRTASLKARMQQWIGSPGTPCVLAPRRVRLARSKPAVPVP